MSLIPANPVPIPWTNQDLVLYHGTSDADWSDPENDPVRIPNFIEKKDFGRGFYTTTSLPQARSWAYRRSTRRRSRGRATAAGPLVIEFVFSRDVFAGLDSISFVRGDEQSDDYWSLVHHCRRGGHHGRNVNAGWFDVAMGPLASSWQSRLAFIDADQVSFHTPDAVAAMNSSSRRSL
jgi:hypothetical protein